LWAEGRFGQALNFMTGNDKAGTGQPLYFGGTAVDATDGKWHHVIAGYDQTRQRVFVGLDGTDFREAPLDQFPALDAPLAVGAGGTGWLHGAIDEIRLYGVAVSSLHGGQLPK